MRLPGRYPGQSALAEEAERYAGDSWPIFPVQTRGKKPLTEHGFQDATTDPDIAAAWWRRWSDANIGLHCRDFTVLDVDPRNGGNESLETLVEVHGPQFKDTVNVLTGGGGIHYYYRGSTHMSHAGQGLDVKSTGGYVILPPSVHPSGNSYEWEYEPGEVDMLELPERLRHRRNPQTAKIYEQRPIPSRRPERHADAARGATQGDRRLPRRR